jgi:hypothetical protein
MTWHFDVSGDTFDLYDHNNDRVRSNVSFSGSWTGSCPDEILLVMEEVAVAEYQSNGFSDYLMALLRDAIFDNIEIGTP